MCSSSNGNCKKYNNKTLNGHIDAVYLSSLRLEQLVSISLAARKSWVQSTAWSRVELWVTFFCYNLCGQGCFDGLVSPHSTRGLTVNTHLEKIGVLIPKLWSITCN